jgi:hypothetical protein
MWVATSENGLPSSGSESTTASVVGEMKTDDAKPQRALGYLRKHLLMTGAEVRDAEERLAYFARVEGFKLDEVYIEEIETWPAAFERLVDAAASDELNAVLLPSMLHFAVLGPHADIKRYFEHLTRTRVLAVSELVSYRSGEATS